MVATGDGYPSGGCYYGAELGAGGRGGLQVLRRVWVQPRLRQEMSRE